MSSPNARIAEMFREIAEHDANNTYTSEEEARNAEKDAIIAKLIIKIAETDARTAKLNEQTKAMKEIIAVWDEIQTGLNEMVRKSKMLLPQGCSRQAFF